jgi:hypothetical protein
VREADLVRGDAGGLRLTTNRSSKIGASAGRERAGTASEEPEAACHHLNSRHNTHFVRRRRDGDDRAALAGNRESPVAAFQIEVLDVGAGGLGDPQPVQREQRDQRMLCRRPEPGGYQ